MFIISKKTFFIQNLFYTALDYNFFKMETSRVTTPLGARQKFNFLYGRASFSVTVNISDKNIMKPC